MAKPIGAETGEIQKHIEQAAHVSNVTPETFLQAVREVSAINAKVAAMNEERKGIRKKWKANGIELGHMDAIMKMADWDPADVAEAFRLRKEYATFLGLQTFSQKDMFANASDDEVSKAEWRSRGIVASRMGRPAVIPDDCPPDYAQDFLEGHSQDLADRKAQMEAAAGIDPAQPGNVAQIGEALKKKATATRKPAAKQDATKKGEAIH